MYDVKPITTARATACGPASLAMLLKYYGVDVSVDALIDEIGIGVTGCAAADVVRAGRAHGLNMRIWQMDAPALLRQDRPAIIWWHYTHFVVFCGTNDKGEPVICNPSSGRFPMDPEIFARAFSGMALCNGRPSDLPPADFFGEHDPEPHYFDE